MTKIPDYIDKRIRQPIPSGLCMVPGSTPIVAFGDARTAKVATLGFNPSHREFQDKGRLELTGSCRRLTTHKSLGVSDLAIATEATISKVLNDCNSYFQRKPYRWWFDQLDLILKGCGVSYYDGSACHLDLVQWATKTQWTCLSDRVQNCLLNADVTFLSEQLDNENIELLLMNGGGVAGQFEKEFNTVLMERCLGEMGPIPDSGGPSYNRVRMRCLGEMGPIPEFSGGPIRLYSGCLHNRVRIIAWNVNLQSSFGVSNELKYVLAERVGQIAKGI